jgi:hypothetical protein
MATVKLELKGFRELSDALALPKFRRRFKKQVRKATRKNGLIAEGAIKQQIASGDGMKPNSPLTEALKGSSRPLVDTGELQKSITHKLTAFDEVIIGVLRRVQKRNPKTGKVDNLQDIAAILHNGATISVTPAMRRLFFALSNEIPEVKPLSPKTTVIVIPARPFLLAAFSPKFVAKYRRNWEEAIERAFRGD